MQSISFMPQHTHTHTHTHVETIRFQFPRHCKNYADTWIHNACAHNMYVATTFAIFQAADYLGQFAHTHVRQNPSFPWILHIFSRCEKMRRVVRDFYFFNSKGWIFATTGDSLFTHVISKYLLRCISQKPLLLLWWAWAITHCKANSAFPVIFFLSWQLHMQRLGIYREHLARVHGCRRAR